MAYSDRFADDVRKAVPNNLSQRQLAGKMNVSQGTVGNMYMGQIPSDEVLTKFANAIGEEPADWIRRAKLYTTEAYLRTSAGLSEDKVDRILEIIEDKEDSPEEQDRKTA